MEKIVLTIGGLLEMLTWSDLFFFGAVLILIMLLVYIIYLIKSDSDTEMPLLKEEKMPSTNSETLEDIVNKLETDYEPKPIDLSRYEQEQETTKIITKVVSMMF
jgi:hypothetical protein